MKKRIENLRKVLEKGEAALISGDINRFYFTGFKSSAGIVLITKNKAVLFIDFRYFEKAQKEIKHLEVRLAKRVYSEISELLKSEGVKDILIETNTVTLGELKSLRKAFEGFNVSEESKVSDKILNMRSLKDNGEIANIKQAQALTDEAFSYILDFIKPDVSEREIVLKMEFFMRERGSEGVAFDFIVVSGKNSSLPHGVPTDKKIEKGDFVTMDFGGVINGYRSDMTRTVAVGTVTDSQRKVYETVQAAQQASLDIIKQGVACFEVDKAARDVIEKAGYGEFFGHGLGHSVGLEIHESPACNTRDKTPLRKGMIMTVEPGIYLPDEFGVRIEDMVVVTDNGYENLTRSSKELLIL